MALPAGVSKGSIQAVYEALTNGDARTIPASPEATNTPAAVALTASTSATLLAANASRIRFTIYNTLATALFCRKAASAATAAAGGYDFVVPPLGLWVSDVKEYAGEIRGICATAGSVNVSESV